MRETGLEPARYYYHQALNLARLPFRHSRNDLESLTKGTGYEFAARRSLSFGLQRGACPSFC